MAELKVWEWEGEAPSQETVLENLMALDPVWGIKTIDYAAHVLPMSQTVKRYLDSDGNRVPSKKLASRELDVPVYKLYMQVAGRLAMLNAAAEEYGWRVNFIPEDAVHVTDQGTRIPTPAFTGGKNVVYREYVEIHTRDEETNKYYLLGRRPGMAALKSGGFVPPWEKMETAARGRALGAWGFGVLPGSGIATLDEMELAQSADFYPGADEVETNIADLSEEEIEVEVRTLMEKLRVVRDRSEAEIAKTVAVYVYQITGKEAEIDDDGVIDLSGMAKPHLELLRRKIASNLREVRSYSE